MNNSLIEHNKNHREVITINAIQDATYIGCARDTARLAAKYASQLSEEYHNLLHLHLRKADPKIAARFTTLMNELTLMTDATYENVRFNRK